MRPHEIEDLYELTPLQQGMLFHALAAPGTDLYLITVEYRLEGALDVEAFGRAWTRVVAQNPVLRTAFNWESADKPLQIVYADATVDLELLDWTDGDDETRDARRRELIARHRQPFSLDQPPLTRLTLVRIADREWRVVWTFHHLLLEGWSASLLLAQLKHSYAAGEAASLNAGAPSYRDYIVWVQEQDANAAEAFWRQTLAGFSAPTSLDDVASAGIDRTVGEPVYDTRRVAIPAATIERLQAVSREHRLTVNTVLQAAWALLLARYAGSDDVVFGSVVSGREIDLPGVHRVVGLCVNTLPARVRIEDDRSVADWLQAIQTAQVRARAFEWTSLLQVQGWSDVPRSTRLFNTIFAYENWASDGGGGSGDRFSMTPVATIEGGSGYPLTMAVVPGRTTHASMVFDASRFDGAAIERLGRQYVSLLASLCADPRRRVGDVPLLDDAQYQVTVVDWNLTRSVYPRDASLHELFAAQVARTPDDIAVAFTDAELTYAELDRRSNRLARHLRGLGIAADSLVGLCVERTAAMVVGMLGILKAGGAYVPLDPGYPSERLAFMADDSGLRVVVTQASLADLIPAADGRTLVRLDTDWDAIATHAADPLPGAGSGAHLAYVIYTSGSTGTPKGAAVPQRAVARLVLNTNYISIQRSDRIAQASSASFDAATFEIWGALLNGARLVGITRDTALSPQAFADELATQQISVLFVTTALFNLLSIEAPRAFAGLRVLLFGGELVDPSAVRRVLTNCAPQHLLHVYGPTECTTFASWYRVASVAPGSSTVAIGRGIGNTQLYVLDQRMRPVPPGMPGELFIGGEGLARGYLRRPDVTADRFVPNPFSTEPGERLYRTGDLVRWSDDGQVVFIARIDGQVKIRGFRLELGEIEAALAAHAAVRQAVVLAFGEGVDKRLAAYLVLNGADRPTLNDELREFLRDRLPDYMVPTVFVRLDAIPLNRNGKVDRAALPTPTAERQVAAVYVAPRSELERTISSVWQELLGVERVGVRDNFFDIGAHSLLIVQARSRLVQALGRDLPIVELFQYPTVEALATRLSGGTAAERSAAPQAAAPTKRRRRLRPAKPFAPIAVIGIAGRFPGAPDVDAFWSNLSAGVESIRDLADDELRAAAVDETLLTNPRYVKRRGILDGADLFDAAFFGYSPREAEWIDPQQRVFLECASEALERAGYDPDTYDGMIGVYAGASPNTYLLDLATNPELLASVGGLQALTGSGPDFLTTRVSYKLNLRGPSVNVQTACSTSLVAVHEACQSLIDGECDIALAGGVSVGAPVTRGYHYQEGGIASPDGHCRAFDIRAGGTVPGHGVGIVVLKRLEDAVDDGDTIHAVIRGTAINNDGSAKVGYTAPSVDGQAHAIQLAQEAAGVEASAISYVEAHGTGTALGDPIEIKALAQAFGRDNDARRCAIGALKSNIGHLDAAAGVAGLIKTVLALEHRALPPSLHFTAPNPELGLERTPFSINTALTPWETDRLPRRAGVSSFGIGGTNAHAVVEEAPPRSPSGPSRPWQLLVVSARTPTALDRATDRLADALKNRDDRAVADAAYTLAVGRRQFSHRRFVVAQNGEDAVQALEARESSRTISGVCEPQARSCVFMFSGQGSQYAGMAAGLYEHDAALRADVDACCSILATHLGRDLRELILNASAEAQGELEQTSLAQPALFVVEYAVARMWMRWAIRPAALVGHSIGELVAACLAGVFSLEDALALVATRGRLMQALPKGAMLAIVASEADVQPMLEPTMSLAALNAPRLTVASGPSAAIDDLQARLTSAGMSFRRLHTSHAFHSAMMDAAVAPFRDAVARVARRAPTMPIVSNVTGTWMTDEQAMSPDYWASHLRQPVRFADGVRMLLQESDRVFLEVGPGNVLATFVRQSGQTVAAHQVVTTLRHPNESQPDLAVALGALGRLWLSGVTIDWAAFYHEERRRRIPLPTYPFERQRFWIDGRSGTRTAVPRSEKAELADWFYRPIWNARPTLEIGEGGAQWLIFADAGGLGARLAARLRDRGHDVVMVEAGEQFSAGSSQFVVNPRRHEDYRALIDALAARGSLPDTIAHMWGVTPAGSPAAGDPETCAAHGFYSLVYLSQALGAQPSTRPIRLRIVTSGLVAIDENEQTDPLKATVIGPCRVIPAEQRHISCRAVDIAAAEWIAAEGAPLDRLATELTAASDEPIVALRRDARYVPSLDALRFESPARVPARLRDAGVYLITGGFGGIGITLADYLARTVHAKLVLLGRTGLPPRSEWAAYVQQHGADDRLAHAIATVERLERAGSEVIAAQADVANERDMRAVVDAAVARWGRIDGVIHSAGVAGGGVIQMKQDDVAARVLAPKVAGTLMLARVLADQRLDFMFLCSSMTAIIGGAGQVDYCAANAFLDAFAARHTRESGTFTVSVNWDAWRDVGMAVETALPEDMRRRRAGVMARAITPEEGADAFARILDRAQSSQVAISTMRPQASSDQPATPAREAGSASLPRHERPAVTSDYAAPATDQERAIAEVWQELLGIASVGRHDNFFELGGHSLMALQLLSRLREAFDVDLPVAGVFDAPTVAGLAGLVTAARGEDVGSSEKVDEMLRLVGDLPEEERQALLASLGLDEPGR